MNGRERWSPGNCARDLDLTIQTNSICANLKMRSMKFFEIQMDPSITGRRSDQVLTSVDMNGCERLYPQRIEEGRKFDPVY